MAAAKMGGAWRHAKSWFPSHMGKAMGEMTERIKAVDVVIEVRDCRAPISSAARHLGKLLSEYGRTQRRLVVLNKADLVTAAHRRAAVANLVADGHTAVHLTSARDGRGVEAMLDAAVGVVAEHSPRVLNNKQSAVAAADGTFLPGAPGTDEVSALPLIMLVAGAPNTGKSSLINALRRACSDRHGQKLRSRKPARTGALPGVTRGLGGFQVSVRPPVWLLDTPGVLPPRIDSWEAALRLGALDLIKEGKGESEALGSYILHLLSRLQPDALRLWPTAHAIATTHAEEAPAAEEAEQDFEMAGAEERRAMRMLAAVARQYELRAHREPDLANAARRIIGLLRDGRLGKICFDEQQLFGRRVSAADREAGDEVEQRYARARRSYRQDAAIRAFRRAT